MNLLSLPLLLFTTYQSINAVRLNTLFQYLDGYKSDHFLQGWLHIGTDYAVLLRKPEAHDRHLTFELYESKNMDDVNENGPRLLAISKVPVEYIKQQLQTYSKELHTAKYVDSYVVPGTQVRTLREWQISKALSMQAENSVLKSKPKVLRTRLD